jgi:hypothetical protein
MENMLEKMMKSFPLFIAMGFMIVVLSLLIGVINTTNAVDYYSIEKVTRETLQEWADIRAGVESTSIWLPYFKFLGLAMILAGITMALGVIASKLMKMGKELTANVPEQMQLTSPDKPRSVMWMRMFMMAGLAIILAGFIVALITAGTASDLYSNPVAVIDAGTPGSGLLDQLASVHAAESWLEAFKFVGIAFLFLGIINGLSTIIVALQYQKQALPKVVKNLPVTETAPRLRPAPAVGD